MAVALPMVAMLGGALWLGFDARRDDALAQERLRLSREAEILAGKYESELRSLAQVAKFNATIAAAYPNLTAEEIHELLVFTLEQNRFVYGACIAFEPGQRTGVVGSFAPCVFRPEQPGEAPIRVELGAIAHSSEPKWVWYHAARDWAKPGTALWTEPYRDPDRQRLMLATVAMPFFRDGVFAGLASIDVRLDELKAVVADSNPRNAWIGILSRQGAMVSWPEQDLHPGETYTSLTERTNRPGIAEIGRHMVNGDSGTAELPDLADPDEQLIVAFTPIPSSGWSLAIAVAQRDVIGPAYAALRERALSSAAILAVVVLIILLLGVWITRPITTLAQSVQALERSGNLEAPLVRVRTADEIGELSKSFNRMVRQLKLRVAELTDATRQREAVLSELRVAREIQTALLPALDPAITTTPDYDLFALNAPARAVAGDFYDFFHLPDARLAIVIADVAGKGVPASIFMAVARTVIRDLASRGEPPGRVLTEANARLLSDNRSGLFVTVFVAYLNTTSGEITYANGGHQPPYVLGPHGLRRLGEATGTVVGVIPEQVWHAQQDRLNPGERLVLYTDGVPDARKPGGECYGEQRFAQRLAAIHPAQSAEATCAHIVEDIDDWQGGDRVDDLTVMVVVRRIRTKSE